MHDLYRFGAFTLDPGRRAVLRDGAPITVTPKAFDILLYLVQHPNRVVSKQDLMKAVWPDTIVEDANLTVNMSLLRKALGDRDDDRLIVTVARQGYQLAATVRTEPAVEAVVAAPIPDQPPLLRRVAPFAGLAVVLVLVAVSMGWKRLRSERTASETAPEPVRLAVLPFENLTGDTARNYLADGLTDELITHLARLQPDRLSVIARRSVMQYEHDDTRLDQIGRDLSVRYAIESSLRQSANRVRVSVRLVQIDNQRELWASDFDYGPQDALLIEDSVAAAVASAVRLHVSPAERARMASTASADPGAVDDVMRGRELYEYTDTKGGWAAAQSYFHQAIARDSNYALAWALLGSADRYGAGRGWASNDSALAAAHAEIDRAIALDPDLPEAWEARGQLERLVDWDWKAAAQAYQHALALDPGDAEAVEHNGSMQLTLGHLDTALALFRHAIDLDPADPLLRAQLAFTEYYAGHLTKIDEIVRSIPLAVQDAQAKEEQFDVALALGRIAKADSLVAEQSNPEDQLRARALVSYVQGRRRTSDSALAVLGTQFSASAAYQIAEVYAFRGEPDSAFAWLDRGYAIRDQGLPYIKADPMFARIRGDPRYRAFLTKMRLP
jgi:TolB-like protein/DNA-binding winged helix-turn-helix (wHTH) protein/Tfp pilus assembly protein PilF